MSKAHSVAISPQARWEHHEQAPAQQVRRGSTSNGMAIAWKPGAKPQGMPHASDVAPQQPTIALDKRRPQGDRAVKALAVADVFLRAQNMPGVTVAQVRGEALRIMRGVRMPQPTTRSAAARRFLALNLAHACEDEDLSDAEVAALLTQLKGDDEKGNPQHSPEELAQALGEAVRDADENALKELLEDNLGGLDKTDEEQLRREIKSAEFDVERTMAALRKAQAIPRFDRDENTTRRDERRERIEEDLHNFYGTKEGSWVLSMSQATDAAVLTSAPGTFMEVYAEIVTRGLGLWAIGELVIGSLPPTEFDSALDKLKKALGDDLASWRPQGDKRFLEATQSMLQSAHVLTTTREKTNELASFVDRVIVHAAPAA